MGVTMQFEDVLFLRRMEQSQMEQQDIVEMSRYHWDCLYKDERRSLKNYRHLWRHLGGGRQVDSRLKKPRNFIRNLVRARLTGPSRVAGPDRSAVRTQ